MFDIRAQNPNFASITGSLLDEGGDEGKREHKSTRGALKLASRTPMQATKARGRMKGTSMRPSRKAKEPKNIKVEEMPRSMEANPNADN